MNKMSNPSSYGRKKYRSSFLENLYTILETEDYHNEINWSKDGKIVEIHQPEAFAKNILPKYFKHGNLESFFKQMNMYNFKRDKTAKNQPAFSHPLFQKGNKAVIQKIARRPVQSKEKSKEGESEESTGPSEDQTITTQDTLKKIKISSSEPEVQLNQMIPRFEPAQGIVDMRPKIEDHSFIGSNLRNVMSYTNMFGAHSLVPPIYTPQLFETRNPLLFNQFNYLSNQIHSASLLPPPITTQMNIRYPQMMIPHYRGF